MLETAIKGNRVAANKIFFSIAIGLALVLGATQFMTGARAAGDTIYVNRNVIGGTNNGSSWDNAYVDLQDALAAATTGDEIWVAKGVYTPGVLVTDTFTLVGGVEIYGGFVATETLEAQRDWQTNITVLSGDIDGNDTKTADGVVTQTTGISGANSFHVITSTGVLSNTILDGFYINAGSATGDSFFEKIGGGMYNEGSSPVLQNLVFIANQAEAAGGGVINRGASIPEFNNVTFLRNAAIEDEWEDKGSGGGMYNYLSDPILTSVSFYSNTAAEDGGAMVNSNFVSAVLSDVVFFQNSADEDGGAVKNDTVDVSFTNVVFKENSSGRDGGGVANYFDEGSRFLNVIFSGNQADGDGGGMYNDESSPALENIVFVGNLTENDGGGLNNFYEAYPLLTNVTFANNVAVYHGGGMSSNNSSLPTVRNSIFWENTAGGNGAAVYVNAIGSASAVLTNTLIQGGCPANSSCYGFLTTVDPNFVSDPDAGDGDWTTLADNDYGDLHLTFPSQAIDSGSAGFVSATEDFDGNPRVVNLTVDLGAYEYQLKLFSIFLPSLYR